jgi:cytochrome c3-like protein
MTSLARIFALVFAVVFVAGALAAEKKSAHPPSAQAAQKVKPTKEDQQLFEKATASWKASSFLDHLHRQKDVGCAGCHGKGTPVKGDTVENKTCSGCHGDYPALAVKTGLPEKLAKRNPHDSHLGDIDCVVCHKAHTVSESYCLGCHAKFDGKIPGGRPAASRAGE